MKFVFRIFNEKYFKIKKFEQNNKIYKFLRIPIYKKHVIRMVKNGKIKNYNLMHYSIEGLKEYEYQSRINEYKHIMFAFVMFCLMIGLCCIGDYIKAILSLILNILVNIYPICLQRYNRIRINKIINIK